MNCDPLEGNLSPMLDLPPASVSPRGPNASIKIVGVGGAGCNAINLMIDSGLTGVQFIAMNTDQQSLVLSKAHLKLLLGPQSSRGLGAGGKLERGAVAAKESREEILGALQGADMVFIVAGMGGGTGTGAAPVIAYIARELGALTVGAVYTPFAWEGPRKENQAVSGLAKVREAANSVITISNERLKVLSDARATMKEAFKLADTVLIQGVQSIVDIVNKPGVLNGDFADVEATFRYGGDTLIGTGQGQGDEAVRDAMQQALQNPLLKANLERPPANVILSVSANWDHLELSNLESGLGLIGAHFQAAVPISLCAIDDPELHGEVRVTVLATGYKEQQASLNQSVEHIHGKVGPSPFLLGVASVFDLGATQSMEFPFQTITPSTPQEIMRHAWSDVGNALREGTKKADERLHSLKHSEAIR